MSDAERQKVVSLDRGLFFVNYRSAEDSLSPPHVTVTPADGHEKRMEIILHPDATGPTLWEPNSGLVVRVNTPGTLQVQVQPMRVGGSQAAVVRIEPIQSGRANVVATQSESRGLHANAATEGLKVLGHVAGRGDVIVGANAWIAGPAAPSRVEGVALEWPEKPAGVDVRYAVQFANGQAGSGRMVPLGAYAGTRGRALPITGMVLEMSGTDELEFVAEAGFLNAPTLRAVGKRVVLSGPTNREPLVGIRIGIERVAAAEHVAPPVRPRKPAGSGRVRVFRSRARQESSVT
ncbi:hypothetical protein I6F35_10610 [Bradyrhizobium sp. BRP22]|uniref:hypothetical protein n=1 Tax=Bradyrhizobium sp. BRP22 TaxID=2793821 RepID=UPI001CD75520|nr:hypothetical protein [Bradyrhizobium sp. BRP22]MCA1453661.1 hypothetical protein [Bradyrhizobium sp. BRP22]